MILLSLYDIHVVYNPGNPTQVNALNSINLNVEQGEFVGILGPSGSGKSTLLYVLGGILRPTKGDYVFMNNRVMGMSERKLAEFRNRNIGFILQDFGLLGDRSVYENICVPMMFSKIKSRHIDSMAKNALKLMKIYDLKNRKVNQLSGGQCQRVAIARAIAMKPKLILADEPTGALDSGTSNQLMEAFKELNAQGVTILMVTHNAALADSCSRVVHIIDGQLQP